MSNIKTNKRKGPPEGKTDHELNSSQKVSDRKKSRLTKLKDKLNKLKKDDPNIYPMW